MTVKDEIRFISAQPDELYFIWQTEVYLTNFISLDVPAENCVALFGHKPDEQPSEALCTLRARFPTVDIRAYPDTRDAEGSAYSASIQPHLIDKSLGDSPHWEKALTFYHDSDIAFRHLPNFDAILKAHPSACVLSDTRDYIGYEYLQACCKNIAADNPHIPTNELIVKMCDVVGIDISVVRDNEVNSGGAQYLLRGVDRAYWQKVYRDSIAISKLFDEYFIERRLPKCANDYIQIWTAGMWSYLWNLWWFEFDTAVHPEMQFLFSDASSSEPASVLHMTGVREEQKHILYNKTDWWSKNPLTVQKSSHTCLIIVRTDLSRGSIPT